MVSLSNGSRICAWRTGLDFFIASAVRIYYGMSITLGWPRFLTGSDPLQAAERCPQPRGRGVQIALEQLGCWGVPLPLENGREKVPLISDGAGSALWPSLLLHWQQMRLSIASGFGESTSAHDLLAAGSPCVRSTGSYSQEIARRFIPLAQSCLCGLSLNLPGDKEL